MNDFAAKSFCVVGEDLRLSSPPRDSRTGPGVYLLWRDGQIVYVGQAQSVLQRAADHCADKDFDASSFVRLKPADLDFVESYLIWFLQPRLNKQLPLLGKVRPGGRGRASMFAKRFILSVLESLPFEYAKTRFADAEQRGSGTCAEYLPRQEKRLRLNAQMKALFLSNREEATDGR